jgi:hypothetical protein
MGMGFSKGLIKELVAVICCLTCAVCMYTPVYNPGVSLADLTYCNKIMIHTCTTT